MAAWICLGSALRFLGLDRQSFWTDEVESLYRSWGVDLGGVLERTASDVHPPLYFLLLWVWRHLGDSEWIARALSAVLGVAFLPIAWALGRRLGGERVGLWTLALAALSPLHLWYSQEARGYALFVLLAALSWLLLLRALERPRWPRWSALAATFAAALLTHPYALFLPLSQLPLLIARDREEVGGRRGVDVEGKPGRRRSLLGFLAAHALAAVLLVPIVLWKVAGITGWSGDPRDLGSALDALAGTTTGGVGASSPLGLPYTIFAWSVGYSLGPPVEALHGTQRAVVVADHAVEVAAVAVLFGMAAVLGALAVTRRPAALHAVAAGMLVPLGGALAISLFSAVVVHPRYALTGFPLYLVLLAAGVTSLPGPRRAALGGGLLALSAWAVAQYFTNPAYAREDARGAIAHVSRHARPGDLVVLNAYLRPYRWYLDAPDPVDVGSEEDGPWFPLYERDGLRLAPLRRSYATPDGVRRFWKLLPEPKRRVWLVESPRWGIDPEGDLRAFLSARYRLRSRRDLPQVRVELLESVEAGSGRGIAPAQPNGDREDDRIVRRIAAKHRVAIPLTSGTPVASRGWVAWGGFT